MATDDFRHLRRDYGDDSLRRASLPDHPLTLLRTWLDEAAEAGANEPNGMALATSDAAGNPRCRIVLCKQLDDDGLVFFTNRSSDKGKEIRAHPRAAATFWWSQPRDRQVRIEGTIEETDDETSDRYFDSRPRDAQLASAASPQSRIVKDRVELERLLQELDVTTGDGPVARPEHWGGYRLWPDVVEFWQGRSARLHDRFRYHWDGDNWIILRLAP